MLNNSFRIILIIFLAFVTKEFLNAQIINDQDSKVMAKESIEQLRNGALVIPLFKQHQKFNRINELLEAKGVDEKSKEKLRDKLLKEKVLQDTFNQALFTHFMDQYKFSKIYFIEDAQLKNFDPLSAVFIDPKSGIKDEGIKMEAENYFILKYFKTSGVASAPEEVRFFFISTGDNELLTRPFPNSPGRRNSFRIRFLDLLNISPNTNDLVKTLVIKLNDNLFRYYQR